MDPITNLDLASVAKAVGLPIAQIAATEQLLRAGNTVPFITRYRKDQTGGLDEERIRAIEAEVAKQRALAERKQTILRSIESQGKLTAELIAQIERADSNKWLEDIYLPFKPRKQTRATVARERGLEPLALEILETSPLCADLDARAADFVNTDKEVPTPADALLGAGHILAEKFAERADVRQRVRKILRRTGKLVSAKGEGNEKAANEKGAGAFRDYFEFSEALGKIPPHRVLAINRGERAKALRVRIEADEAAMEGEAVGLLVPPEHPHAEFLKGCVHDALARLIVPSLEREIRREMTDKAEAHAVEVFARNLRNLLLQPPVPNRRVLAIDPGYKSGCKLVALDEFGRLLAHDVVFLVGSDERKEQARTRLLEMITEHETNAVAIGNGTACRVVEEVLAELIAGPLTDKGVSYAVVNEAGASVYSASPVGREELPEHDATVRGAVSIGRRLQDPLSELVKIDPANIGVGLYQHDVKAKHLRSSLDAVVESCVNYVGVDLNTASPALLRYVSGLNQLTARRVYDYRMQYGPFRNLRQLVDVPGFGESAFVQSAGFLRIEAGDNPLDATWIHPESYAVAEKILARLDCRLEDLAGGRASGQLTAESGSLEMASLAGELEIGELLLKDIVAALQRPGRDPREDLPPPVFRKGIVKLEDLVPGMELSGSVLNVVDFGAFIDIGLSDSGLVHISQLASRYIKDPHEVVALGDVVKVWVLEVDGGRRRVSLTMIDPQAPKPVAETRRPAPTHARPVPVGAAAGAPKREAAPRSAPRPAVKRSSVPPPKPARPVKPKVPITKAMEEGREPMRTFGDLIQYYEKQHSKEDPPGGPHKEN